MFNEEDEFGNLSWDIVRTLQAWDENEVPDQTLLKFNSFEEARSVFPPLPVAGFR